MKFTYLMISLFLFAFTISSCGDDDDDDIICGDNFNLNVTLEAELRDLTLAAQNYAQDPTEENCNAYKASLNAYIDAAVIYEVCAEQIGQADSFNQSITDARTDIEALMCQ